MADFVPVAQTGGQVALLAQEGQLPVRMVPFTPGGGGLVQTAFTNVPDGTNPTTSSATFADLLTLNITTGANPLVIFASASAELGPVGEGDPIVQSTIDYRITIDGAPLAGSGFSALFPANASPVPATPQAAAVAPIKTTALIAGAHIVALQWRAGTVEAGSNTASIDPTTVNGGEHASLFVEEVSV